MKCANCGNSNPKTLHEDGDTFYCSLCCHRTQTATGQDDLITCPYCGRLRDRTSHSCMWCGCSIGQNIPPSKELYEELNESINEFEKNVDESNLRFFKLLGKKKR